MLKNQFIELICSPSSKLYSSKYRQKNGVVLSSQFVNKKLFQAISKGFGDHLERRIKALSKRAIANRFSDDTQINYVIEALMDSHFRKQIHKGPPLEYLLDKARYLIDNRLPIILVGLMFTRKNICPLKRNGGNESQTDIAEVVSLNLLNNFASLINRFYPYGIKYLILSEGKMLADAFNYSETTSNKYQENLRNIVKKFDLKHLMIVDYNDFLGEHLPSKKLELRRKLYQEALHKFSKTAPEDLDNKNELNSKEDFTCIWKSIINSLSYPSLLDYSKKIGAEYDHLYLNEMRKIFQTHCRATSTLMQEYIIERSRLATIKHNSWNIADEEVNINVADILGTNAFRTTINPKPGMAIGILTIRETSSRVQPWHGTGYLETDGSGRIVATVLSKLELESIGALPVYIDNFDNKPICYATSKVIEKFASGNELVFNAATRF